MIVPLTEERTADFFTYLDLQLADNGLPGHALFQPASREEKGFPESRRGSFLKGLMIGEGESGWRRAWVALDAKEAILGHVDLRGHREPHTGHRTLLGMGVHPGHRRQGVARALLRFAIDWVRAHPQLEYIDLDVLSTNAPALALYRQAGFSHCGETADFFRIDGRSAGHVAMTLRP